MTLGRKSWLVGLLAALVLCLVPSAASAVVISVNSNTDLFGPNDDFCELREAITAANTNTRSGPGAGECDAGETPGTDSIVFNGAVFNGTHPGSTIGLVSTNGHLPTITEAVTISGCSATPNSTQPCVGIERAVGSAGFTVFDVNVNNVAISGIAITTPNGVPTRTQDNITGFTLKNMWYGMKLDQTSTGTGTVTLLGDGAVIGGDAGAPGTSPADRNIFAGTGSDTIPSLRIQGNTNQVRGNYFGVKADGATLAFLATARPTDQVVINGSPAPTGNSIGGTIDQGSATECDDACNVIAGASESGVDLEGGGTPADMTTIAGNHIGLDKSGTLDRGNGGSGIAVGGADNVTIGGLSAADRNLISGNGTQGVDSGADSTGMSVGSNYLGLNLAGTAAIPNDTQGAVVNSGIFVFNRVGGTATLPTSGGVVIGQFSGATPVTMQGNVIGVGTGGEDLGLPGGSVSIQSLGTNSIFGGVGPGEANVIGNARGAGSTALFIGANGISVRGSFIGVDADGTTARPNDGTGIQIANSSDLSQVGGTTGPSENVISNNALDAIEILGDATDMNQVLRNFGSNNGGLFLDLAFDGTTGQGVGNPLANGPNEGIQAPTITAVNSQTIAGTADPNSVVRIYRTNTANGVAPTGIIAFAGVTTADGAGNWSLTFAAELPVPGQVTANQTNPNGSSSEFSNAMSYLAPPPPPSGGGTTPAAPVTPAAAPPKKCKKGRKLKKGKCVKKKRKK